MLCATASRSAPTVLRTFGERPRDRARPPPVSAASSELLAASHQELQRKKTVEVRPRVSIDGPGRSQSYDSTHGGSAQRWGRSGTIEMDRGSGWLFGAVWLSKRVASRSDSKKFSEKATFRPPRRSQKRRGETATAAHERKRNDGTTCGLFPGCFNVLRGAERDARRSGHAQVRVRLWAGSRHFPIRPRTDGRRGPGDSREVSGRNSCGPKPRPFDNG